ncbi:MAG: hypothetical protein WEC12_03845 [Balneolaceae bacterium]
MGGYSEVINVIGAMIIFSMILLNANHMIHRNSLIQIEGEFEQEIIALGQEIIEEALSKDFDRVTVDEVLPPTDIPGGFTPDSEFDCPNEKDRGDEDFEAFEDYHCWGDTVETAHGTFEVSAEVFYVEKVDHGNDVYSFEPANSQTTFKKIEVSVANEFLTGRDGEPLNYKLEFVRNYYAD